MCHGAGYLETNRLLMFSGGALASQMLFFIFKIHFRLDNNSCRGMQFLMKMWNSIEKLEFWNPDSRTLILSNELLGFSQSGGLWRSRLGFFTPTHVPRSFYGNFTNFYGSYRFFVIFTLIPRADGGKSKTGTPEP